MNSNGADGNIFVPYGYILISQAIQRTINSNSSISGIKASHRDLNAWDMVRRRLYAGHISASVLKSDGTIDAIPKEFWGAHASSYVGPDSDKICVWEYNDLDGTALITEEDFVRVIEIFIRPLPQAEMPSDLLFLTSTDSEGNEIALTFMFVEDALNVFSEQRSAYFEESREENWRISREALLKSLREGAIRSFHRDHKGLVRQLNPLDWADDGPILARIINSSSNKYQKDKPSSQWRSYTDIQTNSGAVPGSIIVISDEVLKCLKNRAHVELGREPASVETINTQVITSNRAGRPVKYDAEMYLLEAFKIIYLGSPPPKNLEELCARTLSAYNARIRAKGGSVNGSPSETWMKDRLRPLYNWAKDRNSDTSF